MEKKHSSKLALKIILDIIMGILLLMLYQKMTISMSFHEIAGLVIFGLFLIHNILNWSWIKAVTKKLLKRTISLKLLISWITNILLFLSFTGVIITGLMISKTLPINLFRWFGAQQWHYFLAAFSIILMGIHLGLHWSFIKKLIIKLSFIPKKVMFVVGILLLISALAWGCYSIFTGSFSRWISSPFFTPSFSHQEGMGEHMDRPNMGEDFEKQFRDETKLGKGINHGEGKHFEQRPGMGNDKNMGPKLSIINILSVIVTYGSEMIVFAFITVLIIKVKRKNQITN